MLKTDDMQAAQWVESDGVTNLPTADGCYRMRCKNGASITGYWYSYFDGNHFCGTTSEEEFADHGSMLRMHTGDFRNENVDAWWDYQGLMSKPAEVTKHYAKDDDEEQAVFEAWLTHERPSGDADQVHSAWLDSGAYADLMDAREERIRCRSTAIMASDEPGIAAAALAEKLASPALVVTMVNGVECDPAALAAFLNSQRPKPAPNNTPRGIMAVWNEAADHRLGQWSGNFAD